MMPGLYRAVVCESDPGTGRLRVALPRVYGSAPSGWVLPCLPAGSLPSSAPQPGSQVWVAFEGGNPDYPVWIGVLP